MICFTFSIHVEESQIHDEGINSDGRSANPESDTRGRTNSSRGNKPAKLKFHGINIRVYYLELEFAVPQK